MGKKVLDYAIVHGRCACSPIVVSCHAAALIEILQLQLTQQQWIWQTISSHGSKSLLWLTHVAVDTHVMGAPMVVTTAMMYTRKDSLIFHM